MGHKYTGPRVVSVILRLGELFSAAVVVGILSYFIHRVQNVGPQNGRIIYAEVVAALSMAVSLILIVPAMYTFAFWPLDLTMLVNTIRRHV
jgi:membrane protein YdbS with pleckstrin-like domain